MSNSKQPVIAVFWDYINIRPESDLRSYLTELTESLKQEGELFFQRVYFRAGISDKVINDFYMNGFSTSVIPQAVEPGDQIMVDSMSTYFEHPEITSYLLIAKEEGVMSLINFLRSRGREVSTYVPGEEKRIPLKGRSRKTSSSTASKEVAVNKGERSAARPSTTPLKEISLGTAETLFKEVLERDDKGDGLVFPRIDMAMRKLNPDYTGYRCIKDKHGGKFSNFSQFVEEVADRLHFEIREVGGVKRVFKRKQRIRGPQKINYQDWVLIFNAIEEALAEHSPLTEHGLFMRVRLLKHGSQFSQPLSNREIRECVSKIIEEGVLAVDRSQELPKYYIGSDYSLLKSLFLGVPDEELETPDTGEDIPEVAFEDTDVGVEEDISVYEEFVSDDSTDESVEDVDYYSDLDEESPEDTAEIGPTASAVDDYDDFGDDLGDDLEEEVDVLTPEEKPEGVVEDIEDSEESGEDAGHSLPGEPDAIAGVSVRTTSDEVLSPVEATSAPMEETEIAAEPITQEDTGEESQEGLLLQPSPEDIEEVLGTDQHVSFGEEVSLSVEEHEDVPDYSFSLEEPVEDVTSEDQPDTSSNSGLGLDIEVTVEEVDEEELSWDTEEDAKRSMDSLLQDILESKEEAETIHSLVKQALRTQEPSVLESFEPEVEEDVDLGDKVLKGHLFEKDKRYKPY